jgi:hypothetical protein
MRAIEIERILTTVIVLYGNKDLRWAEVMPGALKLPAAIIVVKHILRPSSLGSFLGIAVIR